MAKINLNEIKKFCINLERRPDRRLNAWSQFDQHKLTVERFPAIDGFDFKRKYRSSNANNGCTLSHYFIIERAQILGLPYVMIFEDDAELHPDFERILTAAIAELPADWDMLYFGGSHVHPVHQVGNHLARVKQTYTTHGYILRDTMFQLVIDNFKNLNIPVDCFFVEWQKNRNCFVTEPPVAWQKNGHSDIQGKQVNYDWLKQNTRTDKQ